MRYCWPAGMWASWPPWWNIGRLAANRPRRGLAIEATQCVLLSDDPDGLGALASVPAALLVNCRNVWSEAPAGRLFRLVLKRRPARRSAAVIVEGVPVAAPRPAGAQAALGRIRAAVDAGAGVIPGLLTGFIDGVTPTHIAGWARDEANPGVPVLLSFSADGRRCGMALANLPRADLADACGFVLALPEKLDPALPHAVAARRATDGAELYATLAVIPGAITIAQRLRALEAEAPVARAHNAAFLIDQIARLRRGRSVPVAG